MGTIPVANPSPVPRPHLSRRGLLVIALPLAAVAAIITLLAFSWPSIDGKPARWIDAGNVDALAANEPVRVVEGRFWLVKLESGEVLALSQVDPHLGCTIPWRPDFEFAGRRGWFRNPCHGETYDIDGTRMFGPSPRSMDRYRVVIRDGEIFVDTSRKLCAPGVQPGVASIGCLAPLPSPAALPAGF